MKISASDIKKLRETTGAGILDCKEALQKTEGDFTKAVKTLKELGLAAAAKRSEKATNEGRIFTEIKNNTGGILELSCETDFVARNQDFINFGKEMLSTIIEQKLTKKTDQLDAKVKEIISKIKENITIRRFKTIDTKDNDLLVDYIHGEGRIGVIVKINSTKNDLLKNDKLKEFAFNCALHIAAFNPSFLSKDTINPEYLKEQEEIFTKQAMLLDKPEKVIAGIVKGKMNKHLSEICLLDQKFVKDDKQSVAGVLKNLSKELGGEISITNFIYFRIGERF